LTTLIASTPNISAVSSIISSISFFFFAITSINIKFLILFTT
jgi:hypothetical protein